MRRILKPSLAFVNHFYERVADWKCRRKRNESSPPVDTFDQIEVS